MFILLLLPYFRGFAQEEQTREQAGEIHEMRAQDDRPDFSEDEEVQMSLDHSLRFRLPVNDVAPERLLELPGISPLQVRQFALYRAFRGPFIDLMELQAIPSWDPATIRRVLPFLKLHERERFLPDLPERLRKGEHLLLLRGVGGGVVDSVFTRDPQMAGSPFRFMFRYQYRFSNLLQWGVNMEKDAGESMWGNRRSGIDFLSGHLALRDAGMLKALVLGDFQVSLGQGIIHWQGLSFGMGSDAMSILRQGPMLKPYNGADENQFHRGAGVQLKHRGWSGFVFFSMDRKDANLQVDTARGILVRSLPVSGLHRTMAELEDRDALRIRSMGAGVRFQTDSWHVGWQGIKHHFDQPLTPEPEPYRLFAIRGRDWLNQSMDWGASIRNIHFFGEGALDLKGRHALLTGVLSSLHRDLDLGLMVRNIDIGYRAWQADAHTAQGDPMNERGVYAGCVFRPNSSLKADGWIDLSRFPVWKYRVDGPSERQAFLLNLQWMPEKGTRILLRYQQVISVQNVTGTTMGMRELGDIQRRSWRAHFEHSLGNGAQIRIRADAAQVKSDRTISNGYLVYADIIYKPAMSAIKLVARVARYEADDYSARLFAFEHDVPFQQSMSSFYGKGTRSFMVVQFRPDHALQFAAKAGYGIRYDLSRRDIDLKFQITYRFLAK